MNIEKEKVVTVEYTLKDAQGTVIDTSRGREPLTYIHGAGGMIPGFEAALEGKTPTDKFEFVIAPKEGYGERNESLVFPVPREEFRRIEGLHAGMQLRVKTPEGSTTVMTVTNIEENTVTLDANHPLAGQSLYFDVEVLGVRDATPAELDSIQCGQSCSPSCCESCGSSCGETPSS